MYALVDCNSFFCAVERVFHPGLRGKPVCVLSNNDGCIVALTPEAKALGLHRGDPIFKVRDVVERGGVHVFSGNMTLYAAMSRRVTHILRKSIACVENYSIDESFCRLDGYSRHYNLEDFMRSVANRILTWTDIPVSVGIAPTKTLAKIGSKYAKLYPGYRSVCTIDTDERRRKALAGFPLSDVWGIGRGTLRTLERCGVRTPLELADKPESWVRARLALPGVRTWMELRGQPCIETPELVERQTICTSRSFGEMVDGLDQLSEAVAHFAASCANKLRGQQSLALGLTVFLDSNRFREDLEQYSGATSTLMPVPTADTLEITRAALDALHQVYRPGIRYKRAGVVLTDIRPNAPTQLHLFDPVAHRQERTRLMSTIDHINQTYGPQTVRLAVEGSGHRPWHVKCERRSPNYLTDIREILTVRI